MSSGPAGDGRRRYAGLVHGTRGIAGDANLVAGGDWYDAVTRSDGHLVLVVGEVLDTGVLAVAAMGQLRTALLAHLLAGVPPGAALTRLNQQFGNARRRWGAIALCLQFEPYSGQLRYASAGHPSPLCIGAEGQVDLLHRRPLGPPIGTQPDASYETVDSALPPGARLLFHPPNPVAGRGAARAAGRRGPTTRPGHTAASRAGATDPNRGPVVEGTAGASDPGGGPTTDRGGLPDDSRRQPVGALRVGTTVEVGAEPAGKPGPTGLPALQAEGSSVPVAAIPYGSAEEEIEELIQVRFVQAPRRPRAEDVAVLLLAEDTPDRLAMRLPTDPTKLSPLRKRLVDFLTAHRVREPDLFDLVVAISEAAANAIEHPVAPAERTITVEVRVVEETVVATVRDSGQWRESDDPGFRGRGLALIRALGEVSVNRTSNGTEVTFWRQLTS